MTRRRSHRSTLRTLTVLALVVALLLPSAVPVGDARAPAAEPASNPTLGGPAGAGGAAVEGPSSLAAGERPAAAVAGDPAPAAGGPTAGPRDVEGRRLQLVTGETVALYDDGGEPSYEVVSGGPVRAVTTNDRTYLLPEGVDLGTYDRSLFEVEALRSARQGDGLPVLLETDAPASAIDAPGIRNVRRLRSAGVVAAELDPARAGETVERLVGDGLVRSVELDRPVEGPPTRRLEAGRTVAPPRNLTGEGVTVAVLDTGIDATHPDLEGRVVDRVDLVERDEADEENATAAGNGSDPARDENGHGTLVAGVVAGDGNDDGEHAGVAPGADLIDVRVMDDRGAGHASTIIEGIETAVERDVDVILLSLGTSIDGSDEIAESVEWATERGVVVVAAAGNRGRPRTIGAPGRPGGAITVGATDGHGSVADYSSRGPTLDGGLKPDLVAPGREVVGPRSSDSGRTAIDDDGRYTWASGTSVAAPQVAGVVALLLQAEPGLTPREVEARLGSAARPVDGGSAYAQGSGEVDVRGALDPDVVVSDPAVDFGLIEADRTVDRTITFANHDDRVHALSFDASVRNEDLGVWANGTASLSRRNLSLAPGERANLTLSVDGDAASGAHAGEVRYSVDGEPRSVAFGFVRGGTVTVEKRPLTAGASVDGEALWVLNEEGTHDELLEFENGTASFVAGGGTYLLWSWGTDEPTGTTVFFSERRRFDGPTRMVLDESATVPVGVDAGAIVERYGPLANLSVTASMSTPYGGQVAKLSVSDQRADSRVVRVSRDPKLDVATTYLLATGGPDRTGLDATDVFQLGRGVRGVEGPAVVQVDPDALATTTYRFHRTTVDETYRVQDRIDVEGVWNSIPRRWFDLGGRTVQRIHRVPGATYERDLRGDGWDAYREPPREAGTTAQVLAHPMIGLLSPLQTADGNVTVGATPFADGSGTRFDPPGDHRLVVAVNGTEVEDERILGGSGSIADVPVEAGQRLSVRVTGNNSGGRLSTRTLTEVTVPAYREPDDWLPVAVNRPPVVTNVSIRGAGPANAVPPGEVTAVYEVDAVGPVVAPTVWYAEGDPGVPPWRNRSGWSRAETRWFGGDLLATFDVGHDAGTLSLAAEFRDVRRHRTRTMTADAVHVGAAPNTSTATLVGRLIAPDGGPADNDTVVLDPAGDRRPRFVTTDRNGAIAIELPRGRTYDLTYVRGGPWVASEPTADRRPAWLPLSRVRLDEDVDLGTRSLPPAGDLVVSVTDERGEPVANASVRVTQDAGNVSASETLETGADGLARRVGNERPGIRLAGPVAVAVEPPDGGLYPGDGRRLNVTVEGRRVVNATLETAPPRAVLTVYGTFEPGGVVFLHARKSNVPAGTVEYRWDVDGDGEVDRATAAPEIRHTYDAAGTLRPTVTVVDRAGKTDESALTLRLAANDTAAGPAG